ncbi:DMT family transporter [Litoribacillus peritrichatus]|uniref:EamA family transporter n=1 Tax=Litoribacillus peritrichatus TaxID=718191 RepID=A0ABP7M6N3_9GAMM
MSSRYVSHSHFGWQGIVAIIIACFFWGTTGTAASFTPDVSPLATGAFAMGGGGVLLVVYAMNNLINDKGRLLINYKLMMSGGFSVALYPLAFYSSMRLSGVAVGTVVSIASAPFFTVLLECLISKKSLSRQWVVSFTLGAIGIVLLALSKDTHDASDSQHWDHYFGIVLGLVAGVSYAVYSWSARGMIEQGIDSKSAMACMFGLAALVLLPSLFITGENLFASNINSVVAVYMAVIPMFLGYVLFGYGLKFVEASQATLITLLEPVVATIMAVVIVRESISTMGWIGIGLILWCLWMQVPKARSKNKISLSAQLESQAMS